MVSVGVPILTAIDIVRSACAPTPLSLKQKLRKLFGLTVVPVPTLHQQMWDNVRQSIREGGTLTDPVRDSGLLPSNVVDLIHQGEETGDLDEDLLKAAEVLDQM